MDYEQEIRDQMEVLRKAGMGEWPTLHNVCQVLKIGAKAAVRMPIWTECYIGVKTMRRTTLLRLARYMVTGR